MKAQSPNHWTTREFLLRWIFLIEIFMVKISDSHAEILCVLYPVSLTVRLYYDIPTMILTLMLSPDLIQIPLVTFVLKSVLEKEMAAHSSVLAWTILWMEVLGGLLSTGSLRVRHDWGNLACMHALEKEMATHSSVLAGRIPGVEEPGWLPSMGSQGVRHDWSDLAAAATSMCVFIPQGLHFNFVATAHGMQDLKFPDQGSNQCPLQWNSES